MSTEICNRNHRKEPMFARLPDSQTHLDGRHKCAGCAYDQGYQDAIDGIEPNFRPDELDDSQAGTVRHKSASAAYSIGYGAGFNDRQ